MQTDLPITFALTDHFETRVDQSSYAGKWMLVFFGFTNCRAVCPRNLGKLSEALALFPELADEIQPLYVTVDPARDTPAVMREFLEDRFPRFTGLTGNEAEIGRAKEDFGVFARRVDEGEGQYQMPHTALTYLLDRRGRYRGHWPSVLEVEEIGDRIRRTFESERDGED
ncbi:SCO family protein [Sinorhizobium sp. 8-89]|uniref:SCO family protein n=1 Tax=Sinorhizobium sp. 7-81 TaxID=3049087 RepID=UPI0024C26D47|nr:SCO family protein [Sinorhizobium sp. 7-81]MDK1386490.1 SCO family protein [Sinorhizobium sp. 7-81]